MFAQIDIVEINVVEIDVVDVDVAVVCSPHQSPRLML